MQYSHQNLIWIKFILRCDLIFFFGIWHCKYYGEDTSDTSNGHDDFCHWIFRNKEKIGKQRHSCHDAACTCFFVRLHLHGNTFALVADEEAQLHARIFLEVVKVLSILVIFPATFWYFVAFFQTTFICSVALFPTKKWYNATLFLVNLCSKNTLFRNINA